MNKEALMSIYRLLSRGRNHEDKRSTTLKIVLQR